jgi:hypothetical protein
MTLINTPFLRNTLLADAGISAAAGLLMAAAAPLLADFLALPESLLFWAGLSLFPWAALLVVLARRSDVPRLALIDVVGVNALWVIGSFGILATSAVSPNLFGYAFVTAQALAVALMGVLQLAALRGSRAAAA